MGVAIVFFPYEILDFSRKNCQFRPEFQMERIGEYIGKYPLLAIRNVLL